MVGTYIHCEKPELVPRSKQAAQTPPTRSQYARQNTADRPKDDHYWIQDDRQWIVPAENTPGRNHVSW